VSGEGTRLPLRWQKKKRNGTQGVQEASHELKSKKGKKGMSNLEAEGSPLRTWQGVFGGGVDTKAIQRERRKQESKGREKEIKREGYGTGYDSGRHAERGGGSTQGLLEDQVSSPTFFYVNKKGRNGKGELYRYIQEGRKTCARTVSVLGKNSGSGETIGRWIHRDPYTDLEKRIVRDPQPEPSILGGAQRRGDPRGEDLVTWTLGS